MHLKKKHRKKIDKAMKAFIDGDYETLKRVSAKVYYALVESEFACEVVEKRYEIEACNKNEKIMQLKKRKKEAANSESPTLKDDKYNIFTDQDEVTTIDGYLEKAELVDDTIHFIDDKAKMNAKCMTGVYQIMFDNGLLKKRYNGLKMTKTLALKELNETYKSNIGNDFFRDDPSFIEAAFERMPKLRELVEKLKKRKLM